ncbi:hypothetical protein [Pseudoxanthomonas sacheonensis]|uniref:hypothetical protein n=1 Tax=Pseudoxanthomonas sacheonensis TaxID=443615 RepID=UPI0013D75B24|nr:hypothetical protein [Pseudoxanthomonas sacheonensis]KAF1706271.1 hypothetical protein CSC73_16330 [Pseudoxanthomonas sacheonensis]
MNADEIVREITRRSWRFGVAVLLSPEYSVDCGESKVGGFFCSSEMRLVVAMGSEQDKWLGTLLHEYSHLTQWAEDCAIWQQDYKMPGGIDEWLAGKPCRNARAQIEVRRELEADCERRTIRLIKELQAPIDLDRYTRGANAYIHFHNVMADKRKWYEGGRGPYTRPEVLAVANATLDKDFRKTPAPLRAALLACI